MSSAPEPATVIGSLIGMSVLGIVGVWYRRKSK
ncbi:MAG: PEP-CTERM sorting domain-containing protein [Gemmataceae bacterium]